MKALERVRDGAILSAADAQAAMDEVLDGAMAPDDLSALLLALRQRPPAVDELVGFARSMRSHARTIEAPRPLLDTCGTGGAALKTFNISTCAAFVAAGGGARIAKHGNRSVTRPSGSADVLERAGARLDLSLEATSRVLDEIGIAFLFAPAFHPAMRHAAPVRKALGGKTVFNLLGPLCNPAGADRQVLGVYDPDLVPIMAEALHHLGCRQGMVLHGLPGSDEATPCGAVIMAPVGPTPEVTRLDPADLGIAACKPEALAPVAAEAAPDLLAGILAGRDAGPRTDAVLLNAALALEAAGIAADHHDGLDRARSALADGSGTAKWQAFIEATQRHGRP